MSWKTVMVAVVAMLSLTACGEDGSSDGSSGRSSESLSAEEKACVYFEYTLCQESARCAVTTGAIKESQRDSYTSTCYAKRQRIRACYEVTDVVGDVNVCVARLQSATCEGYVQRPDSDKQADLPLPTACADLIP